MKEYRVEEVTEKRRRLVKLTCDLCGVSAARSGGSWETGVYETEEVEVTIRRRTGTSYPDSGAGQEFGADICPTCFREKLIPWLESQGVKIQRNDYEY